MTAWLDAALPSQAHRGSIDWQTDCMKPGAAKVRVIRNWHLGSDVLATAISLKMCQFYKIWASIHLLGFITVCV